MRWSDGFGTFRGANSAIICHLKRLQSTTDRLHLQTSQNNTFTQVFVAIYSNDAIIGFGQMMPYFESDLANHQNTHLLNCDAYALRA